MTSETSALSAQIAAYAAMRSKLETDYNGKWVVFHDGELYGIFEDFQDAASEAVAKFGRGPYLIRQVGAKPAAMPMAIAAQQIRPTASA